MSLTSLDIESRRFQRAILGYQRSEVDAFLRQVSDALAQAVLERDEIHRLLQGARGEAERVKQQERTLFEALAASERITEDRRQIAQQEAERIIADARRHAEQIINHTRAEVTRIEGQLLRLKVERETFENRLAALLDEHRRLLEIRRQEAGLADKLRTRSTVPPALGEDEPIPDRG